MPFPFITGQAKQPPAQPVPLPQPSRDKQLDPAGYLMDQELADAVNVALLLSKPLLVTGEPGTGKTQLAYRVAWELGLGEPLRFDAKSGSTARDVLYRYDILRRFHAANTHSGSQKNLDYLTYESLGKAIVLSCEQRDVKDFIPSDFEHTGPKRSVVLIDEIDKAPRDFPNDLLLEVENLEFSIPELSTQRPSARVKANPELRPVLILTSNSEQNLPDAFLRRCIYYHIRLPDETSLLDIVRSRLPEVSSVQENSPLLDSALDFFFDVRKLGLQKPPSTAELLDWLQVLEQYGVKQSTRIMDAREPLLKSLSTLAKTQEDMVELTDLVKRRFPKDA